MFRSTRDQVQRLIKIAYDLEDDSQRQQLLDVAHAIGGRSLMGSLPPNDLMASLRSLLEDQGIAYAILGALAVVVHGQPRPTEDIDVLVDHMPDNRMGDPRYTERFGFHRSKSYTGTIMTIDHHDLGYVELLLADTPLRQSSIDHSDSTDLLGQRVPVVDAAHLIGLKVRALLENPSRHRDAADIAGVWRKVHPDMSAVLPLLSKEERAELQKFLV